MGPETPLRIAGKADVATITGLIVDFRDFMGSDSPNRAEIEVVVFDRAHVEPTDASLDEAVAFGRAEGPFDAYVAVSACLISVTGSTASSG